MSLRVPCKASWSLAAQNKWWLCFGCCPPMPTPAEDETALTSVDALAEFALHCAARAEDDAVAGAKPRGGAAPTPSERAVLQLGDEITALVTSRPAPSARAVDPSSIATTRQRRQARAPVRFNAEVRQSGRIRASRDASPGSSDEEDGDEDGGGGGGAGRGRRRGAASAEPGVPSSAAAAARAAKRARDGRAGAAALRGVYGSHQDDAGSPAGQPARGGAHALAASQLEARRRYDRQLRESAAEAIWRQRQAERRRAQLVHEHQQRLQRAAYGQAVHATGLAAVRSYGAWEQSPQTMQRQAAPARAETWPGQRDAAGAGAASAHPYGAYGLPQPGAAAAAAARAAHPPPASSASRFLEAVRAEYAARPYVYSQLVQFLGAFRRHEMGPQTLVRNILELIRDAPPATIASMYDFVPSEYFYLIAAAVRKQAAFAGPAFR